MRTALKSAALQLALVAMVLRALLPAGWMPAAISSADASPFVICTIDGLLHAPTKPSHKPDHDRADRPCVFASAAPLSPLADAVALAPSSAAMPVYFTASHDAVIASAVFRPNAARAPPSPV